MGVRNVAIIFDNTLRPESTGIYCRRALGCLVEVEHFLPEELGQIPQGRFDLVLRVDDGLDYEVPQSLGPQAFWAIDTHIGFEAALAKSQSARFVFAAQRRGVEELRAAGCDSATWLPLAADPVIHRPYNVPLTHDVCFVGNRFPGERERLLGMIAERYPRTFIGRRYFDDMARTYSASRIVFNRSLADDVNMRVFEAMACGRLLLTNAIPDHGLSDLLRDGIDCATYGDDEELFDKLAFYLARDELRERVAAHARAEICQQHTYLHRMTRLLREVERGLSTTAVSVASGVPATSPERCVSACLISWKRPDGIKAVVDRLLHEERLIDDIVVWNNNPDITLGFDNERVTVVNSDKNLVTYGRFLAARHAKHPVIYTQDDDCLVYNIRNLYQTFQLDDTRIAHALKLGHLIDNPANLFGNAHMALVGWGAFFRREWVSVFDAYIERYGEDELLIRKADRLFSLLLNRRQRSIPAAITDMASSDGPEALSVRPDHQEWTARAVQRALELLNGPACQPPIVDERNEDLGQVKHRPYFEHARPDLMALVPESARRILDVGCGAGRLGASLKTRQTCHVTGIELDGNAAEYARQRIDAVHCINIERDEITFADGAFDCVICADILEHLREPAALLRRIRRWLTSNGVLVTSIPNVRNHTVVQSLLAGNWTYESAGLLDSDHVRFFTRREIEKLLYRTEFELRELQMVPGEGYEEWTNAGQPREVSVGGLQIRAASRDEAAEFFAYQYLARSTPAEQRARGMTSIVILTHNHLPLTQACVDSIRLLTDEPFELIFVDNASTDGTPEYLQSIEGATVIVNDENRGFPAAVNQGFAVAGGENILLLNNDTVVTTGWLRRMLDVLHSDEQIGLVGPVSNNVSGEQQISVGYAHLNELDGWAWQWQAAIERDSETLDSDRLVGFCLLIKRSVIDKIGVLDERFGMGCFEDDDFCRRALASGYRAVIARRSFVHHVGSATFQSTGVNFGKLLQDNQRIYDEKWNGLTDQVSMKSATAEPVIGRARPRFVIDDASSDAGGLWLTPNTVKLSVCLIVRDNADTIGECLASIRPWVDEIVVVDTGSVDDTPQICEQYGARLFHWAWRDDFAAARNVSFDHAHGEWLFWMDSDDTIPEECGRKLRALGDAAHAAETHGYVVQVHCPGLEGDVTAVDHVKLIRNRPELRFEFRIHEQIVPAIRRIGGDVAWTDIYVVHSGADQTSKGRQRKLERDFRILHQELEDRPDHPFALFNLGMTHADAGEHAAAVPYLQRCITVSGPQESHLRKAYALLASSLTELGRQDDAEPVCRQGLELFPDDKELLFRQAMLAHHFGRLVEAEQLYQRVLSEQTERHFMSVDAGIAGYKSRHNLAVVHEDMGNTALAEREWRTIVGERPGYRAGWRRLGELLLKTGQERELKSVIQQLTGRSDELRCAGLILASKQLVASGRCGINPVRTAVREFPSDLEAHNDFCRLLFMHERWEEAATALGQLIALCPEDAAVHHNLGAVHAQLGERERAVEHYRESLRLRPNSEATRMQLKGVLQQLTLGGGVGESEGHRTEASKNGSRRDELVVAANGESMT